MGLGLNFVIRVADDAAARAVVKTAKAEAKRQKWKLLNRNREPLRAEFLPHKKAESVVLDFTNGLRSERYVKTNYAPSKVHIAIVEFLDVIKPLCKSMKVQDEFGYWRSRDVEGLREGFGETGKALPDMPIMFTLNAYTVSKDGKLVAMKGKRVVVGARKAPKKKTAKKKPRLSGR